MSDDRLKGSKELIFPAEKYGDDLEDLGITGDFVVTFRHLSEKEINSLPSLPKMPKSLQLIEEKVAKGEDVDPKKLDELDKFNEQFNKAWDKYLTDFAVKSIRKWTWDKEVTKDSLQELPSIISQTIKLNASLYNTPTEEDLKNSL